MGDLGASRIVAPALAIAAPPPGAGIALAASGTAAVQATSATTLSIPYPAGISAGDLLVFYAAARSTPITLPGGWSSMTGAAGSIATGAADGALILACLAASGSESGSLSVTTPLTTSAGRMFRYTGVNATPQDVTAASATSTGTTVTAPDITTVTAGAMEIAVGVTRTAGTTTGPGGYTAEDQNTTASTPSTLYLDRIDAAAGATGTVVFTLATTNLSAAAIHAALRPA